MPALEGEGERMYCSNCGEPVSEGKAFCKECGAPVQAPDAAEAVTTIAAPASEEETLASPTLVASVAAGDEGGELPAVAEAHKIVPPPATAPAAPAVIHTVPAASPQIARASPPEPAVQLSPDTAPAYPAYAPSPARGRRGGLMAGIAVAVVIVIGAAAAATVLLLRDNDSAASGTTVVQVSTTAAPQTTSTDPPSTTVTTGPATTTSSEVTSTSVTLDPIQQYLMATDEVAILLAEDDLRIPELAKQINATAPMVPQDVHDELKSMFDELNAALTNLDLTEVPPVFQQSHDWLDEAATWMADRINATMLGVEAMYDTGSTSSATQYFKQGQTSRDKFRAAFQKFHDTVPID